MATLPIELNRYNGLPNIQRRGVKEWSSSRCPKCGERSDNGDRLRLFSDGEKSRVWCRHCNFLEFANSLAESASPQQIKEWEEIRARHEADEAKKLSARMERLEQSKEWEKWHDEMSSLGTELWAKEGIPASCLDWFMLGYTASKMYYVDDDLLESPALTIPYFSPTVKTVQFKIMNDALVHKYRFMPGIPPTLYYTWARDGYDKSKDLLVVEGAKKAIITYLYVGNDYNVAGLPSKTPSHSVISEIGEMGSNVILLLDPDAHTDFDDKFHKNTNQRLQYKIGVEKTRIAFLSDKVDDWLLSQSSMDSATKALKNVIKQARH